MRYLFGGVLLILGAVLYLMAWLEKRSSYNPDTWTHRHATKAWTGIDWEDR